MAQVFIVDDKTFPIHLKYLFAGTGAKEYKIDYLDNKKDINSTVERMLCGMIADVSRIRKDDKILFYLQQSSNHEGMFFGGFKTRDKSFLCCDDYLTDQLGKSLTFRVEILPDQVYSKGVGERECLDSIDEITKPYNMCWSLIYRKLKGNRGCTMITDREYNFIMDKIKRKNSKSLSNDISLTFDPSLKCIIASSESGKYKGKKGSLDVLNRLKYKYSSKKAYECYLQSYIMQRLEDIKPLHINGNNIVWIGNEVSCGVGMQSIDTVFIQKKKKKIDIIICELKDEQIIEFIETQLFKYIDWLRQYIAPTYKVKINVHPTIIAPIPNDKSVSIFKSLKHKFYGKYKNMIVNDVRYISFNFVDDKLVFQKENI